MERNEKRRGGALFTSECVTVGHPDKTADYISDKIVSEILKNDPTARVAVETMLSKDQIVLAGEVTTSYNIDYESVARQAIREVGYSYDGFGFNDQSKILINIHTQSPDIAMGVDKGGAGDQGLMFGGAWSETKDYMPLPITLARALAIKLTELIKAYAPAYTEGGMYLYPDGKTQVTVSYGRGRVVECIDTIVLSVAHSENFSKKALTTIIKENVIAPVIKEYGFTIDDVNKIFINPTGKFVQHGPAADVGLTGRKIIVDTYGGYCSHGGGAFSGKDPSKVDRSGAYMARYIAKNIVASGIAERCEIQIAYAIGVVKPVSVNLNMFGTNKYPVGLISKAVFNTFDMTPNGIQETLGLRTGLNFEKLSVTGHFGEFGEELPWERTDKTDELVKFCEENYFERDKEDYYPEDRNQKNRKGKKRR